MPDQTTQTTADDARHLIEVRPSSGKGLGIFAISDIPKSTRVLAETGLFGTVPRPRRSTEIVKMFDNLSKQQQAQYLSLSSLDNTQPLGPNTPEARIYGKRLPQVNNICVIHNSNSFGDVFLIGSRSNHSCVANVTWNFNTNLMKMTFHTARDVKAGEELLISYVGGSKISKAFRQLQIDGYGFKCVCPACENTEEGKKKDAKRIQAFHLIGEVFTIAKSVNLRTAKKTYTDMLANVTQVAGLEKSEGLMDLEIVET